MKFDKSLLRTVLFSLGVVSFVIGVYQTVLQSDQPDSLGRNYWIFMISLVCWLPLNYWRQQDARRAKEAEVARQVAALNKPKPKNKKPQRR